MQRGIQEVAGVVPGEHPAGAVGSVRRGRQPDDEHVCVRVAERGTGPPPVGLIGERGPTAGAGHGLAPRHESGARPAHGHPRLELRCAACAGGQAAHLGGSAGHGCLGVRRVSRPPGAGWHGGVEQLPRDGVRCGRDGLSHQGCSSAGDVCAQVQGESEVHVWVHGCDLCRSSPCGQATGASRCWIRCARIDARQG